MAYEGDARFLQALIRGLASPLAPGVLGRLTVLGAMYRDHGDRGMVDLIARAQNVRAAALARAEEAADRDFLNSLIDGSGDLLSDDTFPRMEPLFEKYVEGTQMYELLERAAWVFGDAAMELAAWVQADFAIDDARRRAEDGS
ncbi:MAG: hypothetical protein EON54_00210 [Alcaligenaceae bacterium]|nr:MAG: hypothetical protein EON54_00210 [Alcaligenaceae bacterium]